MSESLKQVTSEFLASRHQLMSFIYGLVRDPQVAEDIFQETWLKLAGALEKGIVIEHQGKWCRQAAKNLILQYWRDQRNAKVVADSALLEFVEFVDLAFEENEKGNGPDRKHALHECVQALPHKSKQLLMLKYEEGISISGIAAQVHQSSAAVVKALLRLRQALAVCVQKKLKLQELGL
jgi:RNA polymerase sigma-70 factor, ECF subfamily